LGGGRLLDDLLLKGLLLSIEDYQVMDVSPCIADNTRIKFIGRMNRKLRELLPVLYLSTPNSKLTKVPIILSFTVEQHNFMIGENGDFAVTFVKDEPEMGFIVEKVIELINRGIKFSLSNKRDLGRLVEEKKRLNPMSLYGLFPGTDCRECGEKSCFNYAAKVFTGEISHHRCPHLDARRVESAITPVNLGWSIKFT
jgi:ArsR family metal-binding transcriptional regulator